ncbi:MAG: MBL fold metallo-hydrolase [Deltaproteobacteria bacterium]|nr:MBL fold metallo-hydrolase [Deltaproteobacteria bacterium]
MNAIALALLLVGAGAEPASSSADLGGPRGAGAAADDDKIETSLTWCGHACFVLKTPTLSVLFDPLSPDLKLPMPKSSVVVDVVTLSHQHPDHGNLALAAGQPLVLRGLDKRGAWQPIDQVIQGVRVRTVGVFHDDQHGKQRGRNAIFVVEWGGRRLVHVGDLGHVLSAEEVTAIGDVDDLLLPVGGVWTIDARAAVAVIAQLKPRRSIVPMHWGVPGANKFKLDPLEKFLAMIALPPRRLESNVMPLDDVTPADQPELVVFALPPRIVVDAK